MIERAQVMENKALGDLESCQLFRYLRIHWKTKDLGIHTAQLILKTKHLEISIPDICRDTFEFIGRERIGWSTDLNSLKQCIWRYAVLSVVETPSNQMKHRIW